MAYEFASSRAHGFPQFLLTIVISSFIRCSQTSHFWLTIGAFGSDFLRVSAKTGTFGADSLEHTLSVPLSAGKKPLRLAMPALGVAELREGGVPPPPIIPTHPPSPEVGNILLPPPVAYGPVCAAVVADSIRG